MSAAAGNQTLMHGFVLFSLQAIGHGPVPPGDGFSSNHSSFRMFKEEGGKSGGEEPKHREPKRDSKGFGTASSASSKPEAPARPPRRRSPRSKRSPPPEKEIPPADAAPASIAPPTTSSRSSRRSPAPPPQEAPSPAAPDDASTTTTASTASSAPPTPPHAHPIPANAPADLLAPPPAAAAELPGGRVFTEPLDHTLPEHVSLSSTPQPGVRPADVEPTEPGGPSTVTKWLYISTGFRLPLPPIVSPPPPGQGPGVRPADAQPS